jgi:hypothetical protein
MATIIEKCFFGDELAGSYFLSVRKFNCKVLVFERNDATHSKDYTEDFNKPAVYILLSRDLQKAYIGETDNFQQRLQSHLSAKPFWNVAYAFTTNDLSISTTEVRYLEAVVHHHVKVLGRYDLSENSQEPQKPPISYLQKINADAFFKTILMMAKLTDCDVLYKDKPKSMRTIEKKKGPVETNIGNHLSLEGRVKLTLNGKGPFVKNMFVHAVVKEYIDTHPDVTLVELKQQFPRNLLGHWDNWELIEDNISAAKKLRDSGPIRHFLKEKDILVSGDGIPFVVCNQWDKNNLPNILERVEQFGWRYSVI